MNSGIQAGHPSFRAETESAAMAALVGGDLDTAATVVIEGYGPELLSFFYAVLRNETEATECFGELCEALWRGLSGFRRQCSLRTWCYVLARHTLARHFRNPHRQPGRAIPLSQAPELMRLAVRVRTKTLSYLRTELKDRFARLRERLSQEQQTLLVLRVDRDLSWEEIARIMLDEDDPPKDLLGRKAGTLRKQFQRTKETLGRMARQDGLLA